MKTVYTILFFADLAILFLLAHAFLKLMDSGISHLSLLFLAGGIILSIGALVLILNRYLGIRPPGPRS